MIPSFPPAALLRISFCFLGIGLPPLSSRQNLTVFGMKAEIGSAGGHRELVSIEDDSCPESEGQTMNYDFDPADLDQSQAISIGATCPDPAAFFRVDAAFQEQAQLQNFYVDLPTIGQILVRGELGLQSLTPLAGGSPPRREEIEAP
jgi:hypothetical protein